MLFYTDESSIGAPLKKTFSEEELFKTYIQSKHKHPFEVHVWGGISKRGATHVHMVIFRVIMTATCTAWPSMLIENGIIT